MYTLPFALSHLVGLGLLGTLAAGAARESELTEAPTAAAASAEASTESDPLRSSQEGEVLTGGEARFVPLPALLDTPRLPEPPEYRDGEEQDELLIGPGGNPWFLGFAAGQYTPPVGERLDTLLAEVLAAPLTGARPAHDTYAFVMIAGRITPERVAALEGAGARVLGYHPQNCLRVALPTGAVEPIADLGFVRWVGVARPWQKLHPAFDAVLTGNSDANVEVYVSVFESDLTETSVRVPFGTESLVSPGGVEPAPARPAGQLGRWRTNGWQEAALEALGMEIDLFSARSSSFRGRLSEGLLGELVAFDFVQFVEPWIEPTLAHDESMAFTHGDLGRVTWNGGANDSVVVGEADTGIDIGHSALNHFFGWGWDLASSGTGPWDDGDSHGTHVAGTILGKADTDRSLDGMVPFVGGAPDLRVFNTKIFNNNGSWGGSTMSDILDRFSQDLDDGNGNITPKPHVINHSWGTAGATTWIGSEVDCRELDTDVWVFGQMHVFAAGNEGSSGSSLRMQGSAKNVFTVGNVRDYSDGTDLPGEIWTSSSRGPTGDLRWKPNVVAPGRWIRSASANTSSGFSEKSGTSMAAPHVVGLAAQLCDHFPFLQYRASTLGAVLMASALTRNGVTLSAPSTLSTGHHNTYGAGRIEGYRAHNLGGQSLYFWNFDMTSSTGHVELDFNVPEGATRLSVVMLYNELPASAGASAALYNDLDMYIDRAPFTVEGNSGEYFSHQSNRDNAETRVINSPPAADYRIKIWPEDLPAGFLNLVRVGVAVVVSFGDTTPDASLTTSLDDAYVQPGQPVEMSATVASPSYVASAVYLESQVSGETLLGAEATLKDGAVADLMDNPVDGHGILLGNIAGGQNRQARWTASWATEGARVWTVAMSSENAGAPTSQKTVIVDGTPPSGPTNLNSATHPVGQSRCATTVGVTWTAATDALSGILGYRLVVDHFPTTHLSTTPNLGAVTSYQGPVSPSASPWYVHLRAIDRAGNGGPTVHYGPFHVHSGQSTQYCTSVPNSTGVAATISSVGGVSLSANSTQLVATGLPAGQPSLFFVGTTAVNVPFGNGIRCAGGGIVRLGVANTLSGTTSLQLDFTQPQLAGFSTPGATAYFQNWFRDPSAGGSGFNLTNGLRMTLCE